MTTKSSELALCLINENTTMFSYAQRVSMAKNETAHGRNATGWATLMAYYADHYEQEFEDAGKFSTTDVLLAAIEVAEYYREHVKEMNTA